MAQIGIPLLFLLGASGYAWWKEVKNNPTSPTDGGPPEQEPSGNKLVEGGTTKTLETDGGPITNPSLKNPIPSAKIPGRVRDNIRKGAHPYNNTGAKHLTVDKTSPGVVLFPPGLKQFGVRDERNKASKVTTRATPEARSKGLAHEPDPLSGVLNMSKHGLTSAKPGIRDLTPQNLYFQARHPSLVPSDWTKIDPITGTDPPEIDFWGSKKQVGSFTSKRNGGVEGSTASRQIRKGTYHFVRK